MLNDNIGKNWKRKISYAILYLKYKNKLKNENFKKSTSTEKF